MAGDLYGDIVWRFSQTPRLSAKTAQSGKYAQSAATAAPAVAHSMRSAQANGTRGIAQHSLRLGADFLEHWLKCQMIKVKTPLDQTATMHIQAAEVRNAACIRSLLV